MFVKRAVNPTLVENYEEVIRVEADLDSITKHTSELEVNFMIFRHLGVS